MKPSKLASATGLQLVALSQHAEAAARPYYMSSNNWLSRIISRIRLFYVMTIEEKIVLRFTMGNFYKIFGGHIFFQTLRCGVELDLFNILKQNRSMTAEQIAHQLGLESQPNRILLLGLTSLGLIKKKGDRYRNSRLANLCLVDGSKNNVTAYVKLQHEVYYNGISHFLEALKTNSNIGLQEFAGNEPTLYERLGHNPPVAKIFQDAMAELSHTANAYLTSYVDFGSVKKVVDIGGGNGTNVIALANRFPHLETAVFDLAPAAPIARENIAKQGLTSRIEFVRGNAFQDEFPRDADCFMFCHFMTIWSKEENITLLRKAYKSLPPGGKVVLYNMMQNDDGSGPLSAAVGSPYFLTIATGKGMLYAWKEYENMLLQAGFKKVERQRLPRDHGVIWGIKD